MAMRNASLRVGLSVCSVGIEALIVWSSFSKAAGGDPKAILRSASQITGTNGKPTWSMVQASDTFVRGFREATLSTVPFYTRNRGREQENCKVDGWVIPVGWDQIA